MQTEGKTLSAAIRRATRRWHRGHLHREQGNGATRRSGHSTKQEGDPAGNVIIFRYSQIYAIIKTRKKATRAQSLSAELRKSKISKKRENICTDPTHSSPTTYYRRDICSQTKRRHIPASKRTNTVILPKDCTVPSRRPGLVLGKTEPCPPEDRGQSSRGPQRSIEETRVQHTQKPHETYYIIYSRLLFSYIQTTVQLPIRNLSAILGFPISIRYAPSLSP